MTTTRWRARVPRARSLADALTFLRAHDPTAQLVIPAGGGGPVDRPVLDGITLESAQVVPGDLFAGLAGARRHGAEYAAEAARAGAVALLSDRPSAVLPTLLVAGARQLLGPLASWLHGEPSDTVDVHGVTGTNGKTSTVHLIAAGLSVAGRRAGWAGSLEMHAGARVRAAERTTVEAPALQEFLACARDAGVSDVALEVSSHGLALDRVGGVRFRTAVFTNLSPDHLDLHDDLESYYASKASLFTPDRCELAVVGVDDDFGRRLARETRCPVVTFSAAGRPAYWRATDVDAGLDGTRFRLQGPGIDRRVRLQMLGTHQVDNALAAVAALVASGVDVTDAVSGVEATVALPGRLEGVDVGQPFLALVDYAHNVGGQGRLLPFLRSLTAGRVIVVLGATGGRDPGKRDALGALVGAAADVAVVTDKSAHFDDPAMLREAVADGARRAGRAEVLVEPDRAQAIALAVAIAAPGDVVVVAGRGADRVLVSGGRTRAFEDRLVLRQALTARAQAEVAVPVGVRPW